MRAGSRDYSSRGQPPRHENMATGGGNSEESDVLNVVTVCYGSQRVTIRVSKNDKISSVIQKAANAFKVPPGGLSIFYHGVEIPDDASVQVCDFYYD